IAWLRSRGITIRTLADAFGANPNHIRVLASRGKQPRRRSVRVLAVGNIADWVDPSRARLEFLDEALQTIRRQYRTTQDFVGGLRALDDFRPQRGRPTSRQMLRLMARWHEERAWFATHAGFTRTALESAVGALNRYRAIYRDSRDPID